jgi:hypothetical protein
MTRTSSRSAALVTGLALIATTALAADGPAAREPVQQVNCLPGDRGYLQASLRGALRAQLDWRGPLLTCQGGLRADEHGIRLSLSGPLPEAGRRLRIIIGLGVSPGQSSTVPTAANVTVIIEGANRIFATRGERHCAVEALQQDALPVATAGAGAGATAGGTAQLRQFRVAARGFCIDPLPALSTGSNGDADRLYIDRFDFAALASFAPESIDATTAAH